MELASTADDLRVRGRVGIGALRLLQVVNVFDLGVRADAVVVPAKVRLPIRHEDGLVLRASERGDGEVPPLREQQRDDEDGCRDRGIAKQPPVFNEPADGATEGEAKLAQRVGLGLGRAVEGAAVGAGVAGGGVAAGSWPDLNFLMSVAISLSSRMFSMKRT